MKHMICVANGDMNRPTRWRLMAKTMLATAARQTALTVDAHITWLADGQAPDI